MKHFAMKLFAVFALTVSLALAASRARGDEPPAGPFTPVPDATEDSFLLVRQPMQPTKPAQPKQPPAQPPGTPETPTPPPAPSGGRTEVTRLPLREAPEMLGDTGGHQVRVPRAAAPTSAPTPNAPAAPASAIFPDTRAFKIGENATPRPQDSLYFSFNFFNNVNGDLNRRQQSELSRVRVYSETFGLEKTFLDGDASIGVRMPLNTYQGNSTDPEFGRTTTALGDLSVILKLVLIADPERDNWLVTGLAVTTPTGPNGFAGLGAASGPHPTRLQPYLGWLVNAGDWYLQGFLATDVPVGCPEVTLLYTDVGLGYFLYRNPNRTAFVTAIAPTVEVHVNTPLNHRGAFNFNDPLGTADGVDLTGGVNVDLYNRARLALGAVMPVTGPRPFSFEFLAQLRMRF